MDNSYEEYLEHARTKSRILLSRLKENSRKVDSEIDKFRSHNSSSIIGWKKPLRQNKQNIWKRRNDSSGVGGVFCPNYVAPSSKHQSVPNMTVNGKILITSKKHSEPILLRRPVKGCYCHTDTRKMQYRSARTKHKPIPCDYCKSHFDLKLENNVQNNTEIPSLSCDTIRRIQSIVYIPKSNFLRNVKSKISTTNDSQIIKTTEKNQKSKTSSKNWETCTKNLSKSSSTMKKTISSKKCTEDFCPLCRQESYKSNQPSESILESKKYENDEVQDLYKFREQNYFDTHGSKQSLSSSEFSGSLEQYLLNERLFPQPAGKIHRKNVIVTMPPCATKQKKKIHYFPRYIVCQEGFEIGHKLSHRNCPLTGHAIDLGILRTEYPPNSLALRFQKRVP